MDRLKILQGLGFRVRDEVSGDFNLFLVSDIKCIVDFVLSLSATLLFGALAIHSASLHL